MRNSIKGTILAAGAMVAGLSLAACSPQQAGSLAQSAASLAQSTAQSTAQQGAATPSTGGAATGTGAQQTGSGVLEAPQSIQMNSASGLVYDCHNLPQVNIQGSSNTITLLGNCQQLNIEGDSNTVHVAVVAQINFTGSSNQVVWGAGPNGGQPQVNGQGTSNNASQGPVSGGSGGSGSTGGGWVAPLGAGPLAPTTIMAPNTTVSYDCGNQSVIIIGGNSTVTLTGTCQTVTVAGGNDKVHLGAVGVIQVGGGNNQVTWQSGPGGGAPTVQNTGAGNTISQG